MRLSSLKKNVNFRRKHKSRCLRVSEPSILGIAWNWSSVTTMCLSVIWQSSIKITCRERRRRRNRLKFWAQQTIRIIKLLIFWAKKRQELWLIGMLTLNKSYQNRCVILPVLKILTKVVKIKRISRVYSKRRNWDSVNHIKPWKCTKIQWVVSWNGLSAKLPRTVAPKQLRRISRVNRQLTTNWNHNANPRTSNKLTLSNSFKPLYLPQLHTWKPVSSNSPSHLILGLQNKISWVAASDSTVARGCKQISGMSSLRPQVRQGDRAPFQMSIMLSEVRYRSFEPN